MTTPDPRDAEIAALREEIEELRARLRAIERQLGIGQRKRAKPPMREDQPPEAGIEPGEPWGLKPPGTEP
jgi:hypothetical protein